MMITKVTSSVVRIGAIRIGGTNPVAVQTMTNIDTNDVEGCVSQIERIYAAGCRIVRLTTQGMREVESFGRIAQRVRAAMPDMALVADVHFLPEVAFAVADYADKVRINPGNYNGRGGELEALVGKCKERGVALRIGVNHGSLSKSIVERWGDTPKGMAESAMDFLRRCKALGFNDVVVSMKSSNVRVMVWACRMLVEAMREENMNYPLHIGVTEAGNGLEGRVKSAVGIGALLADGIGQTVRVSLTEEPEAEIPVAKRLVDKFANQPCEPTDVEFATDYSPFDYHRRATIPIGDLGGGAVPKLYSELSELQREGCRVLRAEGGNRVAEWRRAILSNVDDRRAVVLHGVYDCSWDELVESAAADMGVMLIDGLADCLSIECRGVEQSECDRLGLAIMQATRDRMTRPEYIACPGCGRTLYDLQGTLERIKKRTAHLTGVKIAVMGCVVNGPGEMADADWGYVGAARGCVTIYRGRTPIEKNIPQDEAVDRLVELIEQNNAKP